MQDKEDINKKYKEAKELMDTLGIKYQDFGSGYYNGPLTAAQPQQYISGTQGSLSYTYGGSTSGTPYYQTAGICSYCGYYTCTCSPQQTLTYQTNNYAYQAVSTSYTQSISASAEYKQYGYVNIEDLLDVLSDKEKFKELVSKVKMKAFW